MADNSGLIFGSVTDASTGSGIKGVEVYLEAVLGDAALDRIGIGGKDLNSYILPAVTDDDGKYVLGFCWAPNHLSKLGQGIGFAHLHAILFGGGGLPYQTKSAQNLTAKVFVTVDIRKLIGVGYSPPPTSLPELANIWKDFYASFKELLGKHQVFYQPTSVMTTELYGLLGEVNFRLS